MKRFSLALGILVAAMLLVVGAASADRSADPAGEAGGRPDVTAVTVTSDATATITMTVAVPVASLSLRGLGMDADLNGLSDGLVAVFSAAPGQVVALATESSSTPISVPAGGGGGMFKTG